MPEPDFGGLGGGIGPEAGGDATMGGGPGTATAEVSVPGTPDGGNNVAGKESGVSLGLIAAIGALLGMPGAAILGAASKLGVDTSGKTAADVEMDGGQAIQVLQQSGAGTGGGGGTASDDPLDALNLDLAQQELRAVQGSIDFTEEMRESLGPLGDLIKQDLEAGALEDERAREQNRQVTDFAVNNLLNGGTATPQDLELIQARLAEQQAMADSDINQATDEELDRLRQFIAPSRGLRTTDTPIFDRAVDVSEEALRQKAQTGRALRAAGFSEQLNLPIARQSSVGAVARDLSQLQQNLLNSSRANRASLIAAGQSGFPGSPGTGLKLQDIRQQIALARAGRSKPKKDGLAELGQAAGGIGAIIEAFN